jgi:hypothetical protein
MILFGIMAETSIGACSRPGPSRIMMAILRS